MYTIGLESKYVVLRVGLLRMDNNYRYDHCKLLDLHEMPLEINLHIRLNQCFLLSQD